MAAGGPSVSQKLLVLARLQRSVRAVQLGEIDEREISTAIGALGGTVEADAGLLAQIGRAQAAPLQKLTALLKMAAGETAPLGPAADRARSEAGKLLREPDVRAAATEDATLQALVQAAGLKF